VDQRVEIDQQRRAAVAAQVVYTRGRLRWRHLLVLAFALIVMTACGVGVAGAFWGHAAKELATSRHRLRELLPALLAGYVVAGVLAAWAWARFDPRRMALRLPAVLVLGAVGIAVLLVSTVVHLAGGQGGGSGDTNYEGGSPDSTDTEPQPPAPTLASALVDQEEAAAILGVPVSPPDVSGRALLRASSHCRYRAADRSGSLTVMVRELPRKSRAERMLDQGQPLADIGDRAALVRGGVWVLLGPWLLMLSAHRRGAEAIDRAALISAARRAVSLLHEADSVRSVATRRRG
jgi:hypothetical protein